MGAAAQRGGRPFFFLPFGSNVLPSGAAMGRRQVLAGACRAGPGRAP